MAIDPVRLRIDGRSVEVPGGTTVAAALFEVGPGRSRRSVGGETRAPLCGMGTCFECVVTINGRRWVRSCLVRCEEGMEVTTDGPVA
jgi:D-hydroxyproline dehydrogenase subunit gamma